MPEEQKQMIPELSSPAKLFSESIKRTLQVGSLTAFYVGVQFLLFLLWSAVGELYQAFEVSSALTFGVNLFFVSLVFLYNALFMVVFMRSMIKTGKTFFSSFDEYAWRKMLTLGAFLILNGIAVSVGSFLLIIPGLILLIWWMLGAYVLVIEDTTVRQAFTRSRQLAKGFAWPLLGYLIFFVFLFSLVSLLLVIPYSGALAATLLSLLLTPVWIFYFGLVYQQLAAIKQANPFARARVSALRKISLSIAAGLVLILFSVVTAIGQYWAAILQKS